MLEMIKNFLQNEVYSDLEQGVKPEPLPADQNDWVCATKNSVHDFWTKKHYISSYETHIHSRTGDSNYTIRFLECLNDYCPSYFDISYINKSNAIKILNKSIYSKRYNQLLLILLHCEHSPAIEEETRWYHEWFSQFFKPLKPHHEYWLDNIFLGDITQEQFQEELKKFKSKQMMLKVLDQ